jgi:ribosomal protein S18 acetylase RimI-like enzyme
LLEIRRFVEADRTAVIALWEACGLLRSWNDPDRDIDRKIDRDPDGFLIGESAGRIVAAAMAGYDGHRGWVNYLAVDPEFGDSGIGRTMMESIEKHLIELGCPKINIQVRGSNAAAIAFYERIGFSRDDVVNLGKRLIPDE